MCELFHFEGDDCQVGYKNIFRDNSVDEETINHISRIKAFVANLWDQFKPLADKHFLSEFPRNLDQRYWEMYLACCLMDMGFNLHSKESGPDFKIEDGARDIWIEAVTASPGLSGSNDQVPELISMADGGGAQSVPRDKIILRYCAVLAEKERKFNQYASQGLISSNDVRIIAVSRGSLRRWPDGDTLPYVLSAVFPMGHQFLTIDRKTGQAVGQGRHYQPSIQKANNAQVETLLFTDPRHADISAVIYSNSDIGNPPRMRGDDLMIIHNPLAKNPLPRGCFGFPREFWAESEGDSWKLCSRES